MRKIIATWYLIEHAKFNVWKTIFIIALLLCVNISFKRESNIGCCFHAGKLIKRRTDRWSYWPWELRELGSSFAVRGQIYQAIFETQDENYKTLQRSVKCSRTILSKVIQLDDKNKFERFKDPVYNLVIDFTNQKGCLLQSRNENWWCKDLKML